ncbi:MAG: bifunctional chorismate mutase/prephenate dehydratase, partial [Lachnospiraceae bacterium]|nr:bifunctional chorismate mutase/prephenate dehydratase [Lachnospiraceae bacterium]
KSRVIFQGAEGAYSQAAMEEYFGTRIESFNVGTFEEAMQLVSDNKADYAVLPLENSIAGVVTEVYDLLAEYDNFIVAEQEILIEHCLLGIPGSRVEEINTIYSHPMSLLQSSGFLNEHPEWQKIACENNAFAARKVKELNDSKSAAIAGAKAAAVYGLEVIKENISRSALNTTRFIIISGRKDYRMTADKISICFEVPHQSGSLYHMLSHFIFNNLNMNRIESRPIPDRDWEYRFFVDFTGNLTDAAVINALHGLSLEAVNLKILGNY